MALKWLYFNPWEPKSKSPFGAVQVNSLVTLSLEVWLEATQEVTLVIHKDFSMTQRVKMEQVAPNLYTYEYFLNQGKGLYFYHFEVTFQKDGQNTTLYYGASPEGGEGRIMETSEETWDFQLTCFSQKEEVPDWYRAGIFYQIFPDRFYNGNPNGFVNHPKRNSFLYGTTQDDPLYIKNEQGDILRWDFFGGNLRGIIKKIPYLKELGITGIYLNPIFEAASNHRYDTADFLTIDPVLGTEADFQALVEALHANDMRIILDGVFSHVGQTSRYFNRDGRYGSNVGAYQSIHSPYYSWFQFIHYPETYQSWWGIADLPTVDKTNPSYQAFIYGREASVLTKWNQQGVDGWRLDVADELPATFIQGIRQNLDTFKDKILIGEVWEDASNKISYQERRDYILGDQLHGVMNYPLRNGIIALLTGKQTTEQVAKRLMRLYENYPPDVFFNNLNNIGTHDTERIFTILEKQPKKLDLALGLLFSFVGVPCIYYGDEVGVTGGKDPGNRKFHPWEEGDSAILEQFKKWIRLRKKHAIFHLGELHLFYTADLFGILRKNGQQYVVVLFNPTNHPVRITEAFVFLTGPSEVVFKVNERLKNQTLEENSYLFLES
ncbi:glycoside hydrolase family 13 protein [Enterococcus sp. LJL98]